jgi:hypothetical protein
MCLSQKSHVHELIMEALRAVMTRKGSFLSEQKWLAIPFANNPKDVYHHLLDLIFELCNILEAFDDEKAKSNSNIGTLLQLSQDCKSLQARFEEWLDTLKVLFQTLPGALYMQQSASNLRFPSGPLYSETPVYAFAPEDESPLGPVFTNFLDFPDLAIAQTLLNFWGTFLILQTTAAAISQAVEAGGAYVPGNSPGSIDKCTATAVMIAKSVPYCLQSRFKTAGPVVILHTFGIASQWFEHLHAEREIRWCREVFAKMNLGGNPFEDPEQGARSGGEIRQPQLSKRREDEEANYGLKLPHYGKEVLRLDF